MNFAIVVTNYNNVEHSENLVNNLHSLGFPLSQLFIVDNASKFEDIDRLRLLSTKYPEINMIFNSENIGYFPGLNIGIRAARASNNFSEILIGNNDILFEELFFSSFDRARLTWSDKFVISPDIITLDGVHQNPHVIDSISPIREIIWDLYYSNFLFSRLIGFFARLTRRYTSRYDHLEHRIPRYIYQGYGACYILTSKFFESFDELDAPVFLMGEELFLAQQLEGVESSIYYDPSIQINHVDHSSTGKLPTREFWEISKRSHRVYRSRVSVFSSKIKLKQRNVNE